MDSPTTLGDIFGVVLIGLVATGFLALIRSFFFNKKERVIDKDARERHL
jgi:hypothetical protein